MTYITRKIGSAIVGAVIAAAGSSATLEAPPQTTLQIDEPYERGWWNPRYDHDLPAQWLYGKHRYSVRDLMGRNV